MDNECPGEQICEAEACVAPPPAPLATPAGAVPGRGSIVAEPREVAEAAPVATAGRTGKQHSTAQMVVGIVSVSLAPIPLLLSLSCSSELGGRCSEDRELLGLFAAAALVGIGIPLIANGARRERVATAHLAPWATPRSAGLALTLTL